MEMETEKEVRSAVNPMPLAHLAKLLIEKGLITKAEFTQRLSAERAEYRTILKIQGRVNVSLTSTVHLGH